MVPQKLFAEFIGTFFLVFAGTAGMAVAPEGPAKLVVPAVTFGLAILVMVYSVGYISGAHFNPAVTLGFTVAGKFPYREVPGYWFAQLAGGSTASAIISYLLAPDVFTGTALSISLKQGLVFETVLTFFLMFVIISVATDYRAQTTMAGVCIGIVVLVNSIVGGGATGASMNPARSFGPALVQGQWGDHWIYWIGPAAGAVLASLSYSFMKCAHEQSTEDLPDGAGCC